MKANRKETTFDPVILTLETQAEVDAVFTLLNYSPTANAVGLCNQWGELVRFRNPEHSDALLKKLAEACNIK